MHRPRHTIDSAAAVISSAPARAHAEPSAHNLMQCHLQETFTPWRQLDRLSPSGEISRSMPSSPRPASRRSSFGLGEAKGGGCIQRTRLHSSPCPSLTTRAPSIEFSRTGSPNCHVVTMRSPLSSLGARHVIARRQGMPALGARHVSPRRKACQPSASAWQGVGAAAGDRRVTHRGQLWLWLRPRAACCRRWRVGHAVAPSTVVHRSLDALARTMSARGANPTTKGASLAG